MLRLVITFITTLTVALGAIAVFPRTDAHNDAPVQVTTVNASTSNPKETARVAIIAPSKKSIPTTVIPEVSVVTVTSSTQATSSQNAPTPIPLGTLVVGSSTYPFAFADGETLYDAMLSLKTSDTSFTFESHEYGSMGIFVDAINNQPNTNGKYWFLYINGALASRGVSQTILHTGDRVEWRYEDSY